MKYPEYQLDLLGIEGPHKQTISAKRFWYKHIRDNAHKNDGDIFEFGVYKGTSLLTAALILKELNSKKTIYGFDSFTGFPSLSKLDDLKNFTKKNYFDKKFYNQWLNFINFNKKFKKIKKLDPFLLGTSGDFSNLDHKNILDKISYLKLTNVKLIKGNFKKTLPKFFQNKKIKVSSCNIDCDLYDGYNLTLPLVYKNLTKNGYIFLDEYYSFKYPGAKIATQDFCEKFNIKIKKHKARRTEFQRWYITK